MVSKPLVGDTWIWKIELGKTSPSIILHNFLSFGYF
jgi:hypothetical protein